MNAKGYFSKDMSKCEKIFLVMLASWMAIPLIAVIAFHYFPGLYLVVFDLIHGHEDAISKYVSAKFFHLEFPFIAFFFMLAWGFGLVIFIMIGESLTSRQP